MQRRVFTHDIPAHLVVDMQPESIDALLTDWRWLIGNDKQSLLLTASGDVFLRGAEEKVFWLETGAGTLTQVAASLADFGAGLRTDTNRKEWLLEPVIGRLRNAGVHLMAGQCYGYTVLPVMGGAYDGENRFALAAREHLGLTGHLHDKIKDLPDGTQVKIKWTD